MICAGIDAGSRTIKLVIWDSARRTVVAKGLTDQGIEQARLAHNLFETALHEHGLTRTDVHKVVATGYGRNAVDVADQTITEITCHARGVRHVVPGVATVIDIGGQDSKLIRLDSHGRVRDFAMNDRCAAGTGRFLEVVAARLGTTLAGLGHMAAHSRAPATISSMCVVFAETEIIGLLAASTPPQDIVAGVQTAVAGRVAGMAGRKVDGPVVFTGGVALVSGMKEALESALGQPVVPAPDPQMTGALGAALLAAEMEQ
jgi:(R)-2-hydroxyacyl-CoA dehydratese activating ATPase